jgi:hypothetical protein
MTCPEVRRIIGPITAIAERTADPANRMRRLGGATINIGAMINKANGWEVNDSPSRMPAQAQLPRRAHARPTRANPIAKRSSG